MTGSPTTLDDAGREHPAVELVGITKAFPGVLANDRISLVVRRGEVHCLLGENGAGKSTLMNILSGMVQPDEGQVLLDGSPVDVDSPKRAIELGIGMVYQHTSLVPTLTVLENLMLGQSDGLRLDAVRARRRLQEMGGSLGLEVDPNATTGTLALGQQQQLEIIKALWRGSKVLILDEPTSMLTPQGVAELEQILELAEHVEGRRPRRALDPTPALELDRVTVEPLAGEIGAHDVSLEVRTGEIMGVAGVDGNGQRELAEAIAGQRPVAEGGIRLLGFPVTRLRVAQRETLGLRYVTDDRLGEGTISSLSVALNLVLKRIGRPPYWERGRVRYGAIVAKARELIARYDVRTPGPETRVGALSGGNVQKVVLARELSFQPKVVVYSKPTYGLDVRTTKAVRQTIREQAEEGITSVVISTDLEELLDLCDRIAVLSRGRIAGVVENGPGAAEQVGELMVGGKAA